MMTLPVPPAHLLQSFFAGDAGVCPASARYTIVSTLLPGVGGLVNLVPTTTFALCIWYLRRVWTHHAARPLVSREGGGRG